MPSSSCQTRQFWPTAIKVNAYHVMNPSPFRCLNFLKSWHTTWEMAFQWRGCFPLRKKKSAGKIAPRSLSAWHRKTWYETDTKAKRKKKIWAYLSSLMLKLWVWKCHQAAHLQTSNISVWWEYSEKGHQVVAMQLFCTVFYKHTHTKDPKPPW